MAHKDKTLFQAIPNIEYVLCIFCKSICGWKSASRHREKCRQFARFKKDIQSKNKAAKRFQRLQRQLTIDTNENSKNTVTVEVKKKRACVINAGRYVDPFEIVEGSKFHVKATIQAVFRQRLMNLPSYVPHVEENIMSFFPSSYSN